VTEHLRLRSHDDLSTQVSRDFHCPTAEFVSLRRYSQGAEDLSQLSLTKYSIVCLWESFPLSLTEETRGGIMDISNLSSTDSPRITGSISRQLKVILLASVAISVISLALDSQKVMLSSLIVLRETLAPSKMISGKLIDLYKSLQAIPISRQLLHAKRPPASISQPDSSTSPFSEHARSFSGNNQPSKYAQKVKRDNQDDLPPGTKI
jgi:hypothetical protein